MPALPSPAFPRVQSFPSPNGTVLIVGTTCSGEWVAEFRCLAVDCDEQCMLDMERRVLAKEGLRILN